MAGPVNRVRWDDCGLRIYIDGVERGTYQSVRHEFTEDIAIDEAHYQGSSEPNLDASYRGGSGTTEFRLEHGSADPMALAEEQKQAIRQRRVGVGQVRLVYTRPDPGNAGALISNRFDGVIFTPSERSGEGSPNVASLSFRYERMERI